MAIIKNSASSKYSCMKENGNVYSPIPKKYYKTTSKYFDMVLRPRNTIMKKLKSYRGLCSVASPLRSSRRKFKKLTTNKVKLEKACNETTFETPYQFYRKQLVQTPMTPENPFHTTPASLLRRSKRISMFRSPENSVSNSVGTSLIGRKRKSNNVNARSPLSPLSSGIQTFVANSDRLTKAIIHDEDGAIARKKLRVMNSDAATKSTGWSYSPMYGSPEKPVMKRRADLLRQSVKRRLSARLKKISASQMEPQRFENTENMFGLPRLRGKYNQALYYDG